MKQRIKRFVSKILAMAVTIAGTICYLPQAAVPVYAGGSTLYVGAEEIVVSGIYGSTEISGCTGGSVQYDKALNILTLDNFQYNGDGKLADSGVCSCISSLGFDDELKIELKGHSRITLTRGGAIKLCGIYCEGNMSIVGNGSLDIDFTGTVNESYGIHVTKANASGNVLTIEDATLNILAGDAHNTDLDVKSFAIYCDKGLEIGGRAKVSAIGGSASVTTTSNDIALSAGIRCGSFLLKDNAYVYASGGTGDDMSCGVYMNNATGFTVKGGMLKAAGGLAGDGSMNYFNMGIYCRANNNCNSDSLIDIQKGYVSATGGVCRSTSELNYGIYADKGQAAIPSVDVNVASGAQLVASGNSDAVYGRVKTSVSGKGWTNQAGSTGAASIAAGSENKDLTGYKKVSLPEKTFALLIGDMCVTDTDKSTVSSNGQVSFTPPKGTSPGILTLNGYDYSGNSFTYGFETSTKKYSRAAMYYEGTPDLNIVLKGQSSITNTSTSYEMAALYADSNVTISGSGRLTLICAPSNDPPKYSYGLYVKGSGHTLTIGDKADLRVNGGHDYAISYGAGILGDSILIKDQARVDATASTVGIATCMPQTNPVTGHGIDIKGGYVKADAKNRGIYGYNGPQVPGILFGKDVYVKEPPVREIHVVDPNSDPGWTVFTGDKIAETVITDLKADPGLTVTTSDITAGKDAKINASFTEKASGTVTYTVTGPDNKIYTGAKTVTSGKCESFILKNLSPGKYSVKAEYSGDEDYRFAGVETGFTVSGVTPQPPTPEPPTPEPTPIAVNNVTLNAKSLRLECGETNKLLATISPTDATDKTLTWSSSNKKVATVSQKGVVTGIGGGKTTITVTSSNGKTAACTVKVKEYKDIKRVYVLPTRLNLKVGKKKTLKAIILPSKAKNKRVTWKSSNPKVASVTSSGKVTALKKGKATISVTTADGRKTKTIKLTVK